MNKNISKVLVKLTNVLNQSNSLWSIGASMMLYLRGIEIDVHDIDIMVDQEDFNIVCDNLLKICEEIKVDVSSIFKTKYFRRFVCDSIEIDVMSGMGIYHKNGFFDYQFNKEAIEYAIHINSITLPLSYIEDWYVFYHLMGNRDETIRKIEQYFNKNSYQSHRFSCLLDLSIPNHLRQLLSDFIERELIVNETQNFEL